MTKLLTVFGATGNQGGSVVRAVLEHPQLSKIYSIRAITRDVTKPSAIALKEQGCEVVSANLDDRDSIFKAIKGSSAVFGVTNFWEKMSEDVEIAQGKNMADACKEAGVERFIWSSLPNVTRETHGKITMVKHFDSKAKVEEYTRSIGVPGSYFMPGPFMGMFLNGMKKGDDGVYVMTTALNAETARVPLLSPATDTGLFVGAILLRLSETLNKRILGAGGLFTPNQIVADFEAVTGQKGRINKITFDQMKASMAPAVAEELTANFQLIDDWYYPGEPEDEVQKSIDLVVSAGLETPTTWKDFVTKNFKA